MALTLRDTWEPVVLAFLEILMRFDNHTPVYGIQGCFECFVLT
jgi:hypothetical protein